MGSLANEHQPARNAPVIHLELTEIGSRSHFPAEGVGPVPLGGVVPRAQGRRLKCHQFLPVDAVDLDRNAGHAAGPGHIPLEIDLGRLIFVVFPNKGLLHRARNREANADDLAEGVGPADQQIRRQAQVVPV